MSSLSEIPEVALQQEMWSECQMAAAAAVASRELGDRTPQRDTSTDVMTGRKLTELAVACERQSIPAPPWLDKTGQRGWRRASRSPHNERIEQLVLHGVTPLGIVGMVTLMMGQYALGFGGITAGGAALAFACLRDRNWWRVVSALEAACAPLLASDADRQWTADQIELAEARHQVTPTRALELVTRAHAARTYPDLYAVLADLCASLPDEKIDRAISSAALAVTEGRITSDEADGLMAELAATGDPGKAAELAGLHRDAPTADERDQVCRRLAGAYAEGRLTRSEMAERVEQAQEAADYDALQEALAGLPPA